MYPSQVQADPARGTYYNMLHDFLQILHHLTSGCTLCRNRNMTDRFII